MVTVPTMPASDAVWKLPFRTCPPPNCCRLASKVLPLRAPVAMYQTELASEA